MTNIEDSSIPGCYAMSGRNGLAVDKVENPEEHEA
jgi:hypothetical protein